MHRLLASLERLDCLQRVCSCLHVDLVVQWVLYLAVIVIL